MTFEEVQARIERCIEAGSFPADCVGDVQWMLSKLEAFRSAAKGVFAPRKSPNKKPPASKDGQTFIDAFHQLYLEHMKAKPTWGAAEAKIARSLVKQHGLSECERRAKFMFSGKGPDWIKTRDIKTLRLHFDRFVPPEEKSFSSTLHDLFAPDPEVNS